MILKKETGLYERVITHCCSSLSLALDMIISRKNGCVVDFLIGSFNFPLIKGT